LLCNG